MSERSGHLTILVKLKMKQMDLTCRDSVCSNMCDDAENVGVRWREGTKDS